MPIIPCQVAYVPVLLEFEAQLCIVIVRRVFVRHGSSYLARDDICVCPYTCVFPLPVSICT